MKNFEAKIFPSNEYEIHSDCVHINPQYRRVMCKVCSISSLYSVWGAKLHRGGSEFKMIAIFVFGAKFYTILMGRIDIIEFTMHYLIRGAGEW